VRLLRSVLPAGIHQMLVEDAARRLSPIAQAAGGRRKTAGGTKAGKLQGVSRERYPSLMSSLGTPPALLSTRRRRDRTSRASGEDSRHRAGRMMRKRLAPGKELYFVAPDAKMMAASIRATGTMVEPGVPVAPMGSPASLEHLKRLVPITSKRRDECAI
jgi:hypothetical protein